METIIVKSGKRFKASTVIAAVDVGSLKHMGYCRSQGFEVKPFEFDNNRRGFELFLEKVKHFRDANSLSEIVVGIESTGVYGLPLLAYLKGTGVKLVQVNPKHTKRIKEINGNSPNKTDKKDPRVIADIIELGNYLTVSLPEGPVAELRYTVQGREQLMERKNKLHNQVHALEFQIFPELVQSMDLSTKTAHHILKTVPTPAAMVEYGFEKLAGDVHRISHGKINRERAQALYAMAKDSVGITEGCGSIVEQIQRLLPEIASIETFVKHTEQKMVALLERIPWSKYPLSIKGIGTIITAGLIGELGDLAQFGNEHEVLKYAGLNIFEVSSGKHRGQRRISKVGRPLIRKLLFFAALNTVREGGIMHDTYSSHCHKGMVKIKALVAVMRKLLRIIFVLVRHQSYYRIDLKAAA